MSGPADLSRTRLAGYGLLGLPLAMLLLPLYVHVPKLYAELGLSLSAVGAILLLARLVDALADPVIGHLADRAPGRRRLWITASAPLLLLGVWLLLVPPPEPGAAYLLTMSIFLYLAWSTLTVPYLAFAVEISPDYHQRSRLAAAREGFGLLGTLLALILPLIWQDPDQPLRPVAISLVFLIPLAVLTLWHMPEPPVLRRRHGLSLRRATVLLRRNHPFRRLIGAYFVNALASTLPATLFLLYAQNVLQASEQVAGLCLLLYFGAALAGIPFWLKVAGRWSKHEAWRLALLSGSLLFAPALFLGPHDVHLFMIVSVLTGFCLGADLILPSAMQADVVDHDTARGGQARTGLYTAMWTMATKLAGAATVGLALPLLDWLSLAILPLLYAGLPVLLKLLAARLMHGYTLDRNLQADLRQRIARRMDSLR